MGEKNIKTLDNLGDLASDELIEIIGSNNIKRDIADKIIMNARQSWFNDKEKIDNKKDSKIKKKLKVNKKKVNKEEKDV